MPLMQSLAKLFAKPDEDPVVTALYNICVAQARAPQFYTDLGVPDTVDGRFDLLVLHVALLMRKLGAEVDIKQQLFDLMFADMDQSLREMGIGDMSIGKRIKPMISAFYGRSQVYAKGIAGSDAELSEAIARNVYGKAQPATENLQGMVDYVRRTVATLDQQSIDAVNEGRVEFSAVITK